MFIPYWILALLMPLALLPEPIGSALLLLINLAAFSYTAHRFGANPIGLLLFLLSPPVLLCLLNSNIDGIVVLGFVLPPQLGLFLLLLKPQVGSAAAMYWLVEA